MGKKAATELTFNKIIILILVILVILAVLMFLFKADIIEKIKSLPGYESNPDGTMNLSTDQLKLLNYAPVGAISTAVKSYSWYEQWYLTVYKLDADYDILEKIPTRLILDWKGSKTQSNGDIVIARSWDTDIVIGKMEDNRLTITISQTDYLNYKKQYDALADYSDLLKLNNAKYLGGILFVTKNSMAALPPAEQLNKVSDIIIYDIDKTLGYYDGIHQTISLAPYLTIQPPFLDSSGESHDYRNMYFYVQKEKSSIGIYLTDTSGSGNYNSKYLAGRIYPSSGDWGRVYLSNGVGTYWVISEQVGFSIRNPSKEYDPRLYQTSLLVNYTKLSSKIFKSA